MSGAHAATSSHLWHIVAGVTPIAAAGFAIAFDRLRPDRTGNCGRGGGASLCARC